MSIPTFELPSSWFFYCSFSREQWKWLEKLKDCINFGIYWKNLLLHSRPWPCVCGLGFLVLALTPVVLLTSLVSLQLDVLVSWTVECHLCACVIQRNTRGNCQRDRMASGTSAPNFGPMSILAKRLDGSRCHLVRTYASAQLPPPRKGGAQPP